jgi:predicted type IV restriction endonuclease
MDFIEELQSLSTKIQKQREHVDTEEAAKNAFVLPFITALGYDVFDPTEVVPEFTADIGIKKGEKVDYAILQDGKVVMLFECKKCGAGLSSRDCATQLLRYFQVLSEVRIAVLTDGIIYRFYAYIDKPNFMDAKSFLEVNLLDVQEPIVTELKRFTKQSFNLAEIITAATELKYTREIKRILMEEFSEPSEDLVRIFTRRLYSGGKVTQSILEQFAGRVKRACSQFINDRINERLRSAMTVEEIIDQSPAATSSTEASPGTDTNEARFEFFRQLLERSKRLTPLFANVSPSGGQNWLSAGAGRSGLSFAYVILRNVGRVEFSLWSTDPQLNRRRFDALKGKKVDIEAAFGEPLEWDFSEERKQQYMRSSAGIGGLRDKDKWPQIQEDLVGRMVRLEQALKKHVASLA